MTLLAHRGEAPGFPSAGQPIPHAHEAFDEAIHVLAGRLQITGGGPAQEAHARPVAYEVREEGKR